LNFKILFILITSLLLSTTGFSTPISECLESLRQIDSKHFIDYAQLLTLKDKKALQKSLLKIFSGDQKKTDHIIDFFEKQVKQTLEQRSDDLLLKDIKAIKSGPDFKNVEYMFYVDQFGVTQKLKPATFKNATEMLDHLKDLGARTVYPLPFLKSPMKDGGFDVSNFFEVNEKLGGNQAFDAFAEAARKKGMEVKMDMILNHASDEHPMFQALLSGDQKAREMFIIRDEPPVIVRRFQDDVGDWVDIEVSRRLIFPHITDTHWRKIKIKDKDAWAYHTFYPYQLDINYSSTTAVEETLKIISAWSNKGINIFRFDAIPFAGPMKRSENEESVHALIEVLSLYLKKVSPQSKIMVEANQPAADLIKYFGKRTSTDSPIQIKATQTDQAGKPLKVKGTTEAQGAYDFTELPYFWTSVFSEDKKHLEQYFQYAETLKIPEGAGFTKVARVHDELTLEMATPEQRKIINKALITPGHEKGIPFREEFGTAGRMASFLDQNPKRIKLANSILMGRKGQPVIYYGDEIAAANDIDNMVLLAKEREEYMKANGISIPKHLPRAQKYEERVGLDPKLPYDGREANRGDILKESADQAREGANTDKPDIASQTFKYIREIVQTRNKHRAVWKGKQIAVQSNNKSTLSWIMAHSKDNLLMVNNLSSKGRRSILTLPEKFSAKLHETGFLRDALSGKMIPYKKRGNRIVLNLEEYDTFWLELKF